MFSKDRCFEGISVLQTHLVFSVAVSAPLLVFPDFLSLVCGEIQEIHEYVGCCYMTEMLLKALNPLPHKPDL